MRTKKIKAYLVYSPEVFNGRFLYIAGMYLDRDRAEKFANPKFNKILEVELEEVERIDEENNTIQF